MGRSRQITGFVARIVILLAIAVVVAQDATAQETPLPNAEAYYNRGIAYSKKGDSVALDRAIADYTEVIQLNPKFAVAYYNRGIAYRLKGDTDRAIADYRQAIKLNPLLNDCKWHICVLP